MADMGQVTSTYDLLARVEQGDEYAFTALFEKYQKRLALLIYYKVCILRRKKNSNDLRLRTRRLPAFIPALRLISPLFSLAQARA